MEAKHVAGALAAVIVTVTLTWLIFIPHPEKYGLFDNVAGVAASAPRDDRAYESARFGFSVRIPAGFIPDEMYSYERLGPGIRIPGVAFYVPQSFAQGTDLSPDSYISVESVDAGACDPSVFLPVDDPGRNVNIGEARYLYAERKSAAGDAYDESVYVRPDDGSCVAVRLFMRYRYSGGSTRGFDRSALVTAARDAASSLVIR